jgi:hypothetical protein
MSVPNSSYTQINLDALEQLLTDEETAGNSYAVTNEQAYALVAELRATRKVVEAAKRAITAIMSQPGEFTTDEVGLDDLLAALGELEALK